MNVKFNFDETNVQVGFENQFIVRDLTDKTLVKILMLKGDKGDAGSIKFHVVNELPTENIDTTAIYLVPSVDPSTGNTYDEWVYVNNSWEKIGDSSINVDLTDYVKKTDITTIYSTTSGEIYDVTYINSLIGDIDSALNTINGEVV